MEPIDAVPRDAFLVATVDVAELRKSPISEAILGRGTQTSNTAKALGMGPLQAACGFDPLTRVERLAISAPEQGEHGDFGVAAIVSVTRDELQKCTQSLSKTSSNKTETHDVGRFTVMEDDQHRSIGYGAEGLLVVGKGAWFSSMLAAAQHEEPGISANAEHTALRQALTNEDGWRAPTVVITALLPRSLRERVKNEMGSEARSEGPSGDASLAIMNGVLGVSGAGLAVRAGAAEKDVSVRLELVCDTADACGAVEKLIQKKRLDWSKDLAMRMLGLGPLFDSLTTRQDGPRLRAEVSMGSVALAMAIDRVVKLRSPRNPLRIEPTPSTAPRPTADENVPARDASALH